MTGRRPWRSARRCDGRAAGRAGEGCRRACRPAFGGLAGLLNHTLVRAAAETAQVRVRGAHGERTLPVPRHGQLIVVWRGRAAPSLTPWSADGVRIGPEVSVASGGW